MRLLSKLWLLLYLALLAQAQLLAQSTLVEGKSESVGMSRERLERLDQVAAPHLNRILAEFQCQEVDHPFDHLDGFGPSRPPVRAAWRRIGGNRLEGPADPRDVVGA